MYIDDAPEEGRPVLCVDLPITGVHPIIDDILVAELQPIAQIGTTESSKVLSQATET